MDSLEPFFSDASRFPAWDAPAFVHHAWRVLISALSLSQDSPSVRSSNGSERPSDASRMLPLLRLTIRKAHRPAGHCFFFRCFLRCSRVCQGRRSRVRSRCECAQESARGRKEEEKRRRKVEAEQSMRSMAQGKKRQEEKRFGFVCLSRSFSPPLSARSRLSFASQGSSRVRSQRRRGQKLQKRGAKGRKAEGEEG